ncbi:Bug family tripartite tricarboxylate transporter substrate binding protein [Diaphorobacter caeni]|uniref:Bug family tripartite tricarboxylate transporter substrate binding protein n=1 Tax=Diaphorobacter caeni TaxID=2784387 RepID=UPI0018902264|nr:tripartite tricarboxylate transporter substrate binding protein [Diaphorobacter caeni]MBF5006911.1 tripartite tricarboxylate transporter substrate binding protein [Diaphorobacter caeni]
MKAVLSAFVLCTASLLSPLSAQASDFPSKPIRLVVPYPPGGTTDVLARTMGQKLSEAIGQPVLVDNRPGASEAIAASLVAKSPPDGYTIFLTSISGLAVNPGLYGRTLTYNPQKDFAPLMYVGRVPSIIVVNPKLPVQNMQELRTYLQSGPDRSYASPGNGTTGHLGMEMYKKAVGLNTTHVPYKGGAPALQDMMAGQTDVMMGLISEAMPMVKGGKLRALAVTTLQRSPAYPDLPTVAESGLPGFEMFFWYAFVAPAGTPPTITAALNKALNQVLVDPSIRSKFNELSIEAGGGAPQKVTDLTQTESVKWKKVIDDAGIKVE